MLLEGMSLLFLAREPARIHAFSTVFAWDGLDKSEERRYATRRSQRRSPFGPALTGLVIAWILSTIQIQAFYVLPKRKISPIHIHQFFFCQRPRHANSIMEKEKEVRFFFLVLLIFFFSFFHFCYLRTRFNSFIC